MKIPYPLAVAGAFVLAMALQPAPAGAEIASGAVLANTCFSCHGPDGNSAGSMPTISGKSERFIISQLQSFRAADPEITVMGRIAKGFSDDEITALAKFFAGK